MRMPTGTFAGWIGLATICEVCGTWPARSSICEPCITQFAQPRLRCERCAQALASPSLPCVACATRDSGLDRCVAAVDYAYPWDRLIQAFKFSTQTHLAQALAGLIRHSPWAEPTLDAADLVLGVPLSNARIHSRGYNQAHELAKRLAPAKTAGQVLMRVRDTPTQLGLSAGARDRNMRQAFAIHPGELRQVAQRHVVLIDDVMTSGATLRAAAAALRQAGAARIDALVVARTDTEAHVQHRPGPS